VKRIVATVLSAVALAACSDSSPVSPVSTSTEDASLTFGQGGRTVYVTNANDAGAGSLRAAVAAANANPAVRSIEFRTRLRTISLLSTVEFTGTQELTIDGNRATIDASAAIDDALRFTGGGDLRISNLTVKNAGQEGLDVEVPSSATGAIKVTLINVTIAGNKGHGVLVNDQLEPDVIGDTQPNAAGSDASVEVHVLGSRFERNGFSVSDRDGLRVNEGGLGDLTLTLTLSSAADNAADGVEIDERGDGDVKFTVTGSQFTRNGTFDPEDLDDGFDIDEYDAGSIIGKVVLSSANDNLEEGFDFNENNAGDFRVDMTLVEASGNREEGIDFEEDDDFAGGGDLVTTLVGIKANRNGADGGDAGLKIREKGDGILTASVKGVETSDNLIGGISIREDATGSLTATISAATVRGNTGNGIDFDENSSGDLTASVTASTSADNTAFGVRADQQLASGAGTGTLQLTQVTLTGNSSGTTTGNNVVVTVTP
jgi:hypothetical protein